MSFRETKATECLKAFSQNRKSQTENGLSTIDLPSLLKVSKNSGLGLRELEIKALQMGLVPRRYLRNMHTLSIQDQICLLQANIAIFGVGGLGGYILELLARMGVGRMLICDGDRFEESNLNRQLMSNQDNLGQNKAIVAKEKINSVNSSVDLSVVDRFAAEEELPELFKDKDLVVDALGGLEIRRILFKAAEMAGLPMVSGFIAGATGGVSTVFPGDKGLLSMWEGHVGAEERLGCLAHTASAIASMQCAEVVNLLCGKEVRLKQKMAVCDLEECSWEVFELPV